ncbi:type II toxin-antitoxin system RelE family toxin [Marinagarivorans algicola]|uniref:type II toxin-antitoxin system RelE family toxin n=1 Tax=Marinagarivorans algicola TaxID=1513270 RepID=UPI0006B9474B|nr:type II toxin-antitoxin system RelE/ParE family toxin [Marinagarivorans algicola]
MALALKLSRQAGRFIKTLPPKQYKQVVSATLALLNNPEPHDSKQLKGSKDSNRRADVGEYRIVYRAEGEELLVLVIGKRNDDEVYKILDRQS